MAFENKEENLRGQKEMGMQIHPSSSPSSICFQGFVFFFFYLSEDEGLTQ